MIYILSWTTEKGKKSTFQAAAFKVEENSRTFQGKMKLKDFLRTFPNIFKDCAKPEGYLGVQA